MMAVKKNKEGGANKNCIEIDPFSVDVSRIRETS